VDTGGGNAWDANGATLSAFLQTAEPGGATWAGVEKVDVVGAGGGNGTAFNFTRSAA
jgi:hypothetical protein